MDSNPYYNPEEFGLEMVGSLDLRAPDYSFDIFVVWRNPVTGVFYSASDSGCSCPSPFESTTMSDLTTHSSGHDLLATIKDLGKTDEDPVGLISRIMAMPAVSVK